MMTKKERKQAEEISTYDIDVIIGALAIHCSDPDTCTACPYMNDSDGTCNVLEHICDSGELTSLDTVPYGDRDNDYCEDPDPDRDWREIAYNV